MLHMISSESIKSKYSPGCLPDMFGTIPGDSENVGSCEFTTEDGCCVEVVVADAGRVTVAGEVAVVGEVTVAGKVDVAGGVTDAGRITVTGDEH